MISKSYPGNIEEDLLLHSIAARFDEELHQFRQIKSCPENQRSYYSQFFQYRIYQTSRDLGQGQRFCAANIVSLLDAAKSAEAY